MKKTSWNKSICWQSKQNNMPRCDEQPYVSPYIAKNGDCIYIDKNKNKNVSDYLLMREMLKKKGLTY